MRARREPVEADDAREIQFRTRGLHQAGAAAEAEADRKDAIRRAALRRAEIGSGSSDVLVERLGRDKRHVGLVVEPLVALSGPRGAAEEVERDGIHAGLRESQRELLEERVQAPDVGQDHHACSGGFRRPGRVCGDLRAVGGGQREVARVEGGAADRRQRWSGISVITHALSVEAAEAISVTTRPL